VEQITCHAQDEYHNKDVLDLGHLIVDQIHHGAAKPVPQKKQQRDPGKRVNAVGKEKTRR
jgi:hypothetical protein